jgi:tetratricopeptide (TPR) repeat protein
MGNTENYIYNPDNHEKSNTKTTAIIITLIIITVIFIVALMFIQQNQQQNSVDDTRPEAYLEQAASLYTDSLFDECIDFITDALITLSRNTHSTDEMRQIGELYIIMGNAFFELGEYQSAATAFEASFELNPQNADLTRDFIISLALSGALNRAEEVFQNNLHNLPKAHANTIMEQLSGTFIHVGEFEKALVLLTELSKNGDSNFTTRYNLAFLHQQLEEFDIARNSFAELMEEYPDDYRPPMRLAFLIIEQQQQLVNEEREYADALNMYLLADSLADTDDVDLFRLTGLITELRMNGWIE